MELTYDDKKLIRELTVSTYELGNLYTPPTYVGDVITVPNTGSTQWGYPTRTITVGEHEFKVHPDGTIHVDPEAFVKLLEQAGIA